MIKKHIYIYQFKDAYSNTYQIVEEIFEGFEKVKILYAVDENYKNLIGGKYTLETKWIKRRYTFPFDMKDNDVIKNVIKNNSLYFI